MVSPRRGSGALAVRPRNWDAPLPGCKLAWAESNREACQANLSNLNPLARARAPQGSPEEKVARLLELAGQIHQRSPFCPDLGRYRLKDDGREVRCSCHGSFNAPMQRIEPDPKSPLARLMAESRDLAASLTFLPEGLQAVVTIERGGDNSRDKKLPGGK